MTGTTNALVGVLIAEVPVFTLGVGYLIRRRLDKIDTIDTRVDTIDKSLAVVSATVTGHERWHERNDPRLPMPGGATR
jgi:hypothetical protein